MNIRHFSFNPFQTNTFIAWESEGGCVVIDPSFCDETERRQFMESLEKLGTRPEAVLLTHGHTDHIYGVKAILDSFGCPVYMSAADIPVCGITLFAGLPEADPDFKSEDVADGQVITAAGLEFKVITTPGHTPGSVCWLNEKYGVMFSGDTLFAGSIGRTDLPMGEYDDLIRSIMDKLMGLDGDTVIMPGHGGRSTIGWERTHNPFLEPFNEKEEEFDPDAPAVSIHP